MTVNLCQNYDGKLRTTLKIFSHKAVLWKRVSYAFHKTLYPSDHTQITKDFKFHQNSSLLSKQKGRKRSQCIDLKEEIKQKDYYGFKKNWQSHISLTGNQIQQTFEDKSCHISLEIQIHFFDSLSLSFSLWIYIHIHMQTHKHPRTYLLVIVCSLHKVSIYSKCVSEIDAHLKC